MSTPENPENTRKAIDNPELLQGEIIRSAAIEKTEHALKKPEAILQSLFQKFKDEKAANASKLPVYETLQDRQNLLAYMLENRGFNGPTERFVASEKLFATEPELYKAFVEQHTRLNQGQLSQNEKIDNQKRVETITQSFSYEGQGITGDQSPAGAKGNFVG